jgi:hypothetical protein
MPKLRSRVRSAMLPRSGGIPSMRTPMASMPRAPRVPRMPSRPRRPRRPLKRV